MLQLSNKNLNFEQTGMKKLQINLKQVETSLNQLSTQRLNKLTSQLELIYAKAKDIISQRTEVEKEDDDELFEFEVNGQLGRNKKRIKARDPVNQRSETVQETNDNNEFVKIEAGSQPDQNNESIKTRDPVIKRADAVQENSDNNELAKIGVNSQSERIKKSKPKIIANQHAEAEEENDDNEFIEFDVGGQPDRIKKTIEVLNISCNNFKTLPSVFYKLSKLKKLYLFNNQFSHEEKKKIRSSFPSRVQIYF
jgi:hypothetical protein